MAMAFGAFAAFGLGLLVFWGLNCLVFVCWRATCSFAKDFVFNTSGGLLFVQVMWRVPDAARF